MLRPRQYVYKSPHRTRKHKRSYGIEPDSWMGKFRIVTLGLLLFIFDSIFLVWLSMELWDILCTDPDFRVAKIYVQGVKSLNADQVIQQSKLQVGQNIFKADIREARRILEEEPLFRRVDVSKQLPREIFIKVTEREPIAQIINPQYILEAWLVDSDGILVSNGINPSNLYPLISMHLKKNSLHLGIRVEDQGLTRALKVVDIFSGSVLKKMLDLEMIEVPDPANVILRSTAGLVVHLGSEDYENRLIRLLSILEDLGKKNQSPLSIDLRFRYVPVVLNEEYKKKHEA